MSSDDIEPRPATGVGPRGFGHSSSWMCMGCGIPRSNLGAKGTGIHRRCATCVAAKAARKAP